MEKYILNYSSGDGWREYPVIDVQHAIRLVKELKLSTSLTEGAVAKFYLEVVNGNFCESWRDDNGMVLSEVIASKTHTQMFFLAYEFVLTPKSYALEKEIVKSSLVIEHTRGICESFTYEDFLNEMQEKIINLRCNGVGKVTNFHFTSVVPLT